MTATTARIATLAAGSLLTLGLCAGAPAAGASPATGDAEEQLDCDGPSSAPAAWKTPDRNDGDHPSGRDGKGLTEPGGSGTQGASGSDPDGSSNGGADKPGCDGGFDVHDRDGNNGCGNDHDFEDDNNGWCGRKPAAEERDRSGDEPAGDDEYSGARLSTGSTSLATPAMSGIDATGDAEVPATVAGAALSAGESGVEEAGADGPSPVDEDRPGTEVLGITAERPDSLARTGLGLGGVAAAGGLLLGSGRLSALARRLLR